MARPVDPRVVRRVGRKKIKRLVVTGEACVCGYEFGFARQGSITVVEFEVDTGTPVIQRAKIPVEFEVGLKLRDLVGRKFRIVLEEAD